MRWPCWDSALPTSPALLLDTSFRSKSDLCKTSLNGFGSVLPPALPFHNTAFHPCCIRSFFLALRWCLVYLPLVDLPSQLFLRFSEPGSHCPSVTELIACLPSVQVLFSTATRALQDHLPWLLGTGNARPAAGRRVCRPWERSASCPSAVFCASSVCAASADETKYLLRPHASEVLSF